MSQESDDQKLLRLYRQATGVAELDMHEVAKWAMNKGMAAPKPQTAEDILARRFSKAARREMRTDGKTGRRYRVNHAVQSGQTTFWVDIDFASRNHMQKSSQMRREQMVGEAMQLTSDLEHWNSVNPDESPIAVQLDLQFDVDMRRASEDEEDAA